MATPKSNPKKNPFNIKDRSRQIKERKKKLDDIDQWIGNGGKKKK